MEIAAGLCRCGCGESTSIIARTDRFNGYEKGDPRRYIKGHHWHLSPVPYVVEDRGYKSPCWIWQRAKDGDGYSRIGQKQNAHVVYYEAKHGAVPVGLEIDHLCRVRACVNPDHLEAVTQAENNRRRPSTARYRRRNPLSHEEFKEPTCLTVT